jgi:hypothetical protein
MYRTSSLTGWSFLIILIALLLSACTPVTALPTPVPPTETQIIPSATSIPSTATLEPLPTFTETAIPPSPTAVPPTETPPASGEQQTVQIYLIAVDDNGKSGKLIGCGDSVIPVQVPIPPTQGVLRAALNALLSNKDQFYGESGLYNALYQSNLQVGGVSVTNGQAIIHLTGTLMMGGECDIPRVEAQLTEIALQFSTVTSVAVYINDIPLKDVLSLK